jgi:hypothetical protein
MHSKKSKFGIAALAVGSAIGTTLFIRSRRTASNNNVIDKIKSVGH